MSGRCDDGWDDCGGTCVPAGTCTADAGAPDTTAPDAAPPPSPDASPGDQPDAEFCPEGSSSCRGTCVDTTTDPDNCGACGAVCESHLCVQGMCMGGPTGHVVLVGHDYVTIRAGMNRLVGNAVFLVRAAPVRVRLYQVASLPAAIAGTREAIQGVAYELGRTFRIDVGNAPPTRAEADVFVVVAQHGATDEALDALGSAWSERLMPFLAQGGVVIVLEGAGGETHRILSAAGLIATTARTDVTGTVLSVSGPSDAVATAVPSVYLAEPTTVAFATMDAGIVVDGEGRVVAAHWTLP